MLVAVSKLPLCCKRKGWGRRKKGVFPRELTEAIDQQFEEEGCWRREMVLAKGDVLKTGRSENWGTSKKGVFLES